MSNPHPQTIDVQAFHEVKAEFYFLLGQAMSGWADIERGLYYWFRAITNIQDNLGRALFYGSNHGFRGKLAMIEAAIEYHAAKLSDIQSQLIKEAVKKARKYSEFRNSLAHGEMLTTVTPQPQDYFVRMVKAENQRDDGFKKADIIEAIENFDTLAQALVLTTMPPDPAGPPISLEQYLQQVRGLPNEAHLKNDPISPRDDKPAQPGGRVNKKEFRAAQQAAKEADKGRP